MTVTRIIPNIATEQMDIAKAFYGKVLDMTVGMDHGWIITFMGTGQANPQISFATEGGSGTPVPDLRSRSMTCPWFISEWSMQVISQTTGR